MGDLSQSLTPSLHHLLHPRSQYPSPSLAWPRHHRGICHRRGLSKPLGEEHQERKSQLPFSLLCFLTNSNNRTPMTTESDPFHPIEGEPTKHIKPGSWPTFSITQPKATRRLPRPVRHAGPLGDLTGAIEPCRRCLLSPERVLSTRGEPRTHGFTVTLLGWTGKSNSNGSGWIRSGSGLS